MKKKLTNNMANFLLTFTKFRNDLQAIAVESTYNWYWLVEDCGEAKSERSFEEKTAFSQTKDINDIKLPKFGTACFVRFLIFDLICFHSHSSDIIRSPSSSSATKT